MFRNVFNVTCISVPLLKTELAWFDIESENRKVDF